MGVRLSSRQLLLFAALSIMGLGGSSARADRAISAFEVFDRVRGMWLGQLVGNAAGRASEGLYSSDGRYSEPVDLTASEALDHFRMYQAIRFRFTPTIGDAIRIVGAPGGSKRFTTILELEVEGDLCEDANATTIDPTDQ